MSDFQDKIKEWLTLDNDLKMIKLKKDNLKLEVLDMVKKDNLDNVIIKTNDSDISFENIKTVNGVTLQNIQTSLEKNLSNSDLIEKIMNDIKNSRTTKINFDIKRKFKK